MIHTGLLEIMRRDPLGRNAALVGYVESERDGDVLLHTVVGGTRVLDMLAGEQLPRIC